MNILPAIDILDGKCVRLYKGDYSQKKIYYDDPLEVAEFFSKIGSKFLHIVDLDAARGEGKNNRTIIKKIADNFNFAIEVGGGIRTEIDIEQLLECGIKRLILGTVLAKNFSRVEGWSKKYGKVFVAGIDALNNDVKISGWEKSSGIKVLDLAKKIEDLNFSSIIYTNISRDGTLEGPDLENSVKLANSIKLPVIISGGVSCDDDFKKISAHKEIWGVITGKAVYENKIDIEKIIKIYQRS